MASSSSLQASTAQGGTAKKLCNWTLVAAVNNDTVLRQTLLASTALDSGCEVILKRGFASAGEAYNTALAEATNEIVVFAHQDVFLPETWKPDIERALEQLSRTDPDWGVLGAFGVAKSNTSRDMKGFCYSTGLKRILGHTFPAPVPADSLDELLLIIRRSSGLRFDEKLPGFHLYGADICMEAAARKMNNYILSAFCIHNSNGVRYFPRQFWSSYFYLRKKWWIRLPVATCCTTITKGCGPMFHQLFWDLRKVNLHSNRIGVRCGDVPALYQQIVASDGPESYSKLSSSVAGDQLKQIMLLGATFSTQNMGVGALAAGALRCLLTRYPGAQVRLLDYSEESEVHRVSCNGQQVSVPLVNMRFSKRFYLTNNIALLLSFAAVLRMLPSGRLRDWLIDKNDILRQIYKADFVTALSGGDSFSDIYGLERLLYCGLPLILVILMRKKLVLLPQTHGPFRSTISKKIARYILTGAERVYARDRKSLATIESLVGADFTSQKYAFSYDLGFVVGATVPSNIPVEGISPHNGPGHTLIGLNVSGLLMMGGYSKKNMFGLRSDYSELMDQLVELFLKKENTSLLLVPHVFGTSPENDVTACEKVYERLAQRYPGRLGMLRGSYNESEIKYIVGICDFFIGSRMHACIAALSQCVPCLPIAYSDKFIGVIDSLCPAGENGGGLPVVDARKLNAGEILDLVGCCYDSRFDMHDFLQRTISAVKESALRLTM